eukprot:scaffold38783_cov22-Tisochrysis_lutea.AAC.1
MSANSPHSCRRIMVWSAADNPVPDKLHTTHDAITSCHFSADDRLLAVGTQVHVLYICMFLVAPGCYNAVQGGWGVKEGGLVWHAKSWRSLMAPEGLHLASAQRACVLCRKGGGVWQRRK